MKILLICLLSCRPNPGDPTVGSDPLDSNGNQATPDQSGDDNETTPLPSGEGFQTQLPIVKVDTRGVVVDDDDLWDETGRAWASVDLTLIETRANGFAYFEDPPSHVGFGGMHVRGNSTASYDKKSYAIETWDENGEDTDVALLGFPEEEDWILHGPFSDKTLMRNHLMYQWSRSIGRYAARSRFVELFVEDQGGVVDEGDYRGVYLLMEKIKRDDNRVDISKLTPTDTAEPEITGGYLLKKDWYDGDQPSLWVETSVCGDVLTLVDPDGDEITDGQRQWLTDWLDDFEQVLMSDNYANPSTGYAAWIDVNSFVDHHLLVEMGRNVDGYVLSTYLYKDRGGKLTMGPIWDYNGALGNADYFESWDPEGWHWSNPEFPADNPTAYCWYERLFEDPNFQQVYAQRWQEFRKGSLATEALLADIDVVAALLAEPSQRNFERWPVLGEYVWPNAEGWDERDTYQKEVDYLKSWLTERTEWMDSAVLGTW